MAVSPIGNVVLVNQMTPAVSNTQNAHNNRVDFQNMAAQAQINEKDEKVLKIRPAEENHETDPDREHTRDEADRETQRALHEGENENSEENKSSLYKLDIKV